MPRESPITSMLAAMVADFAQGSRWHSLAPATEGMKTADLDYAPPRPARTWWPSTRDIMQHVAKAATRYSDHLAPPSDDPAEAEWPPPARIQAARTPAAARGLVDIALRRQLGRAATLTDEKLPGRTGMWGRANSPRLLLLIDGAMLHTAYHFGQVAMLMEWRRASEEVGPARPECGPVRPSAYPGRRDWSDCRVATRTEACVRLLRAAYEESPFHSVRVIARGITARELGWEPFPGRWGPGFEGVRSLLLHLAWCKVMYADHAFGTRSYEGPEPVLGPTWWQGGPRRLMAALDRSHAFLAERVAAASDAELDRVNPMHHGHAMTGWQVVSCMAQHDAWHAGQVSIVRDAYAALAGEVAAGDG
jgi:uncharacterized damage-inducible protein DinB